VSAVRRALVTLVAVVAATLGLLLLVAGPASAHAQLISSSPADGQRLETSPTELLVTVSERTDLPTVVVSLVGADGPVRSLDAAADRGVDDRGHQTIGVPVTTPLPPGLYRMTFTARSAIDGHTATSQVVFGVRVDVAASAGDDATTSTDSWVDAVRGLLQGMLLTSAGLAFGLLVLGAAIPQRGRRAAVVAALVAFVAAAGAAVVWHEGNGLVVGLAGMVGSLGLWRLARDARRGTWSSALACLALVTAVAPLALVGHAAALGGLLTMVAVLHVVTTAAWTGALGAAVVLTRGTAGDDRIAVLRRTSTVGATTFLVAIVSGLLMGQAVVPSVGGLLGSAYGLGLVVKVALLLPVLALALLTRERLRHGRATSVRVEAGVLLAVAAIGVFVAAQPPPVAPRFAPTPSWTADSAPASVSADDLLVSAQVVPNTPGDRFLVARVDDTRRPAPAVVTGVAASLGSAAAAPLVLGKDGFWTATVHVPDSGPTQLRVVVSRPGMDDAAAVTTWTVAPVPGTAVGGSPLTRYVAIAIAGLVTAWLLVLLVEGLAIPRRRVDEEELTGAQTEIREDSLV
jgi:copper transport protein